jgi:CRISPR/Cas system endoribonuclease Cas6 (RAMP superfamily)
MVPGAQRSGGSIMPAHLGASCAILISSIRRISMTTLMDQYLELERRMIAVDNSGDEAVADALRDRLDLIWYQLSDQDHEVLNRRTAPGPRATEPKAVPGAKDSP